MHTRGKHAVDGCSRLPGRELASRGGCCRPQTAGFVGRQLATRPLRGFPSGANCAGCVQIKIAHAAQCAALITPYALFFMTPCGVDITFRCRMHATNDTRLVRCLDGLSMSFAVIEQIDSELYDACSRLLSEKELLPAVFWRAWSFVDTVHRIREVAQAVPGLSSKTSEMRKFLTSTEVAESFRHYIQHLRGELSKRPGNTFPAWGSLAWVDPNDPQLTHMALAGAQVGETHYAGLVFDTVEQRWVSRVALSVGGLSFNFDLIAAECMDFRNFILPWLLQKYAPGINLKDELPIISMRFQPGRVHKS
ncbi:MAG: hypothetical protein H6R07_211 [Proteobacteria bacterium]|nr:hypothetical protein [Pseudomonadota bacterium]